MKLLGNNRWMEHPWSKTGMVYHIPTWILNKISNPNPTDSTDLLSGEIVHQSIVWKDIVENGMADPLLMVIGLKNKTIRLEAGNHRIIEGVQDGYTHLPTAFKVIPGDYLHPGNGTHTTDASDLVFWHRVFPSVYPYQASPYDLVNFEKIKEKWGKDQQYLYPLKGEHRP